MCVCMNLSTNIPQNLHSSPSSSLVMERVEERHRAVDVGLPTTRSCDGARSLPQHTEAPDSKENQEYIFRARENQELKKQDILRGPQRVIIVTQHQYLPQ